MWNYKEGDIVEVFRGDPGWEEEWRNKDIDGGLFGHQFKLDASQAKRLNQATTIIEIPQKYRVNYSCRVLRIVASTSSPQFSVGDWVIRKGGTKAVKITHRENISDRFICGMRRSEVRLATREEVHTSDSSIESDLDRAERLANNLSSTNYPDTKPTKVTEDDFAKAERLAEGLIASGCDTSVLVTRSGPSPEDPLLKAERLAAAIENSPGYTTEVGRETYRMIKTGYPVGPVQEEEKCMPPILLNRPRRKQRSIMVEKMQAPVMYHALTGKHKLL